jgi:hypothetical protein
MQIEVEHDCSGAIDVAPMIMSIVGERVQFYQG